MPARERGSRERVRGPLVSAAGPSRKQARRDALFLLYQHDVTRRPLAELVEGHRLREAYPPDDFTMTLVNGVLGRRDELDAVIGAHSREWPVARLAPLERSALRLAVYELESGLTPPEVAIDEAVRLTRRYATDEAGALVNGILGAVARERALGAAAGGGEEHVAAGGDEAGNGDAEEAAGGRVA